MFLLGVLLGVEGARGYLSPFKYASKGNLHTPTLIHVLTHTHIYIYIALLQASIFIPFYSLACIKIDFSFFFSFITFFLLSAFFLSLRVTPFIRLLGFSLRRKCFPTLAFCTMPSLDRVILPEAWLSERQHASMPSHSCVAAFLVGFERLCIPGLFEWED